MGGKILMCTTGENLVTEVELNLLTRVYIVFDHPSIHPSIQLSISQHITTKFTQPLLNNHYFPGPIYSL